MNSANINASPKFKNICSPRHHSPKELKDKMRKNYKDKVQRCRQMLIDKCRRPTPEKDLCNTLTEIYMSMFNVGGEIENDELTMLEELQNEFIQEELEWWLQEYERSHLENVDWSKIEEDDSVICPVCQKSNYTLENHSVSCTNCKTLVKTEKSLKEIKAAIISCVDKHSTGCTLEPQFTVITEANETHVYIICDSCSAMIMVL